MAKLPRIYNIPLYPEGSDLKGYLDGLARHMENMYFNLAKQADLMVQADGDLGRVIRNEILIIMDGTNANTLKIQKYNIWNGKDAATVDNVAKGATTSGYTLNGVGTDLKLADSLFNAPFVACLAENLYFNSTGVYYTFVGINESVPTPGDFVMSFYDISGAAVDLTAAVQTGSLWVKYTILTDG